MALATTPELFPGKRDGRSIVFPRSHAPVRKNLVFRNPLERLLEDLPGIGLEYDPLTRTPAPRIHHGMEALREFVLVIMGVEFRPQIDIPLRPPQGAEVSLDVLRIHRALDHGGNHEGGVD